MQKTQREKGQWEKEGGVNGNSQLLGPRQDEEFANKKWLVVKQ